MGSATEKTIFSSYVRKEGLFDEVFKGNGNVKSVYYKLLELYGLCTFEGRGLCTGEKRDQIFRFSESGSAATIDYRMC